MYKTLYLYITNLFDSSNLRDEINVAQSKRTLCSR